MRKICIISIQRYDFVIIGKNTHNGKRVWVSQGRTLEAKDERFKSANVNIVGKWNSGI